MALFGLIGKKQKEDTRPSVEEIKQMYKSELVERRKSFQEMIVQAAHLGAAGTVNNAYTENVWVFSAVRKIGNLVAKVPLRLKKITPKLSDPKVYITDRTNPWIRLFNNPNPLMEKNQLWKATLIHYEVYGECFWILRKSDGWTPISKAGEVPGIIDVAPKGSITPRYSDDNRTRLIGWTYTAGTATQPLELWQVLRFFEYNPEGILKSISPTTVAKTPIEIDHKAHIYNDKFFKNGGQIAGYLLDESEDSDLTDEEARNIRDAWDSNYGGLHGAHKTPILTNGLKFVPTGATQKDMDFMNMIHTLRDEIVGSFGVPKNKLGIYDGLSFANSKQANKDFYLDILIPKMDYLVSVINLKMLGNSNVEVEFDYSVIEALKEERDTKINGAVQLYNMGYGLNQINEAQDLGMPYIDEPWANQAEDTRGKEQAVGNPQGRPANPDQSGENSNQDASNQREGRNGKDLLTSIHSMMKGNGNDA